MDGTSAHHCPTAAGRERGWRRRADRPEAAGAQGTSVGGRFRARSWATRGCRGRHHGCADSLVAATRIPACPRTSEPWSEAVAPVAALAGYRRRTRAASIRDWLGCGNTTPGKLVLVSILVVAGATCFGVIENHRRAIRRGGRGCRSHRAAAPAGGPSDHRALDANATAATTFLTGGLEPPRAGLLYLQDLTAASAAWPPHPGRERRPRGPRRGEDDHRADPGLRRADRVGSRQQPSRASRSGRLPSPGVCLLTGVGAGQFETRSCPPRIASWPPRPDA